MKEKKFTELLKEFMESLLPGIPEDEVCLQCSYSIDADGNSYLYKKCAMCIAKENEVVRLCPKCNGGGTVPGPYFGVMCPSCKGTGAENDITSDPNDDDVLDKP